MGNDEVTSPVGIAHGYKEAAEDALWDGVVQSFQCLKNFQKRISEPMKSQQLYGYSGKILEVDLSKMRISEERLDHGIARRFIGGAGLAEVHL